MPRKGSKQPYKARVEYKYTVQDIAYLAGMTRNALNVAKVHGKIDPADFKSVVSFLVRRIVDKRLSGDLFAVAGRTRKRGKKGKGGDQVSRKKTRKTAGRK
jgi:hypothetical protein